MTFIALLLFAASGACAGETAMDQLHGIREYYSILPIEETTSTGTLHISRADPQQAVLFAEDMLYDCTLSPLRDEGEFTRFSLDCVERIAKVPLDLSLFEKGLTIAVPSRRRES